MFKVGDRVVVLFAYNGDKQLVGKVTTVISPGDSSSWVYLESVCGIDSAYNKHLVLEEIYNSPLYQVLKEEN